MSPFASFAGAAALLTLTPGPDALLVLRTAVSRGRAGAIAAGLGVCTALAGWGCAAAFGLTALLTAAPLLYTALRWAGAAYLGFLGTRLILGHRPRWRRADGQPAEPGRDSRRLGRCYLQGVITNAANPKIGVFYLSLLPQFITVGAAVLGAGLLLAAIHVAESMTWFAVIAVLAGRLDRSLRRPVVRRWMDRVAGTAFLAFAARLAVVAR
ncbi:MAG: LysE family translocator [Gemmatimonadota bacterium]